MAVLQDSHNPASSSFLPLAIATAIGTQQIYSTFWMAQTFIATASYDITSIALRLAKNVWVNSKSLITVSIRAVDGSHKPTGSDLCSGTVTIGSLPQINGIAQHYGANPWTTIQFTSSAAIASGTEYAIVVRSAGSNYIFWTGTTAGETGVICGSINSGSSWTTNSTWDACFQTYSNFALQDSFGTGSETGLSLGGVYWGGQSFTPSTTCLVKSVSVRMKKTGTMGTSAILSIRDAAAGIPSGADRSVAVIQSADIGSGAFAWYDFVLDTPYKLTGSTQYTFVVRDPNGTYPSFELGMTEDANGYANGTKLYSTNSGGAWSAVGAEDDDVWFKVFGIATAGYAAPLTDAKTVRRLIAFGANQLWYEDSSGDMQVLTASIDDIDLSKPIGVQEAYGKLFIANDTRLRVADFVNVKIATADIGTYIPDFNTVLTGSTSGAEMIVDYIDASSGATTVYGRRTTATPFNASEAITGTDNDGNAVSFTLTAAGETLPPHWYNWTPYSNDTTNYGEMPDKATLISEYNGRLVLAGNDNYAHEWWMSAGYNPWMWLYVAGTPLGAVSSGSFDAGQMGDVITALIPYADDYFLFGCASSLRLLDGDPTFGGTVETLSDNEGVFGSQAWCKDAQSNLYYFSGDGLYKATGGRDKPICLSEFKVADWSKQWDLNSAKARVTCSYDPHRKGVLTSYTSLLNGSNKNYWYDIRTTGFYPESYPDNCGIFSSFFYDSLDVSERELLFGCTDGYIRTFEDSSRSDIDTDDSTLAINAWVTLTPAQLNPKNADEEGILVTATFILGGGASGGFFADSDGMTWELFVGTDAETVMEKVKDDDTEFATGSLSATGRSNKIRPRARGHYATMRLSNTTDAQSFAINKIIGTIKLVGGDD